jgi:hypothetical protein
VLSAGCLFYIPVPGIYGSLGVWEVPYSGSVCDGHGGVGGGGWGVGAEVQRAADGMLLSPDGPVFLTRRKQMPLRTCVTVHN